MPFCSKCGNQIMDNVRYCPKCGASCQSGQVNGKNDVPSQSTIVYVQAPQQQSVYVHKIEKSKGVALLLCFFLGDLGIHQFYLGNTVQGIPALISIVDFIIILCMSESYFHQKYDRER